MVEKSQREDYQAQGFNNLTKSLSFNIYDVCYARSRDSQISYLQYIDEEYNSKRLETIVEDVTQIINAKLVSISTQDYEPRGASVVADKRRKFYSAGAIEASAFRHAEELLDTAEIKIKNFLSMSLKSKCPMLPTSLAILIKAI